MSVPLPDVRFQTKWLSRNPLVRAANDGFHRTLVDLVRACRPRTLLDAGCGEGITLLRLAREGAWDLQGIDGSAASLDIARRALGEGLPLRLGDLHDLPYDDGSFDLVLGTEVLEHVADPRRALAEMVRVSRAHLVLSVPREPLWRVLNVARGKYWRHLGNTDGHLHHWSGRQFVGFVSEQAQVLERRNPVPWTFLRCARPGARSP